MGAPLKGFRDYPPPDAGARSQIRSRMRAAARRSGFVELETPSVESLDLFTTKSGEEIVRQLWDFTDKGGRHVALVPETTPSLARVYGARAKAEPLPVKWFTISKLWRFEDPQAGREREFSQFNLDILGVPGIEAEVEVLATSAAVLDSSGAEGLYTFRINDRALAEGIGKARGIRETAPYFHAVDRFRKSAPEEFLAELARAGLSPGDARDLNELFRSVAMGVRPADAGPFFERLASLGLEAAARAGLERLRGILDLAEAAGIVDRIVVDPTVVRGLAYYTSSVFEAFATSGDGRSLFGGGRYDRLIELFGGPPTPAVGLAIGDQTLEDLLRENQRWPEGEPPLETYVICVREDLRGEATRIVQVLRSRGISADRDLLGRSFARQLREAARRRARRVWLLGLKEVGPDAIVERDLSTGVQREFPRSEVQRLE